MNMKLVMAEDKVANIVAEVGHRGRRARAACPQRQVEPERGLRLEVGIADLQCEVAVVLAEEIQLLERRVARGVRASS